jgi:hypothetical protein
MPVDEAIAQHFTEELKADPVVSQFYEKGDYKSVPDIMKGLAHAQHRLGSVVPLPNADSKPEDIAKWRQEHLPKLVNAKLVDAPRQLPEKYELKKPENLPEGAWSDALEGEAYALAKKHGWSQEALNEAYGLYQKSLAGFGEAVKVDRQAMAGKVKEWADKEGMTLDQVDAALDRFNKDPNGWDLETAEAVSKSGYADNPLVIKAIVKLMKDSGTFDTRNSGGATVTDEEIKSAQQEIAAIRGDKTHPKYELFQKGDPATKEYVESLYKKLTGGR